MPYITQWVEPDLLLEHQGVHIWHTYKEEEYEDPNTYWFTNDPDNMNECSHFDVRGLETFNEWMLTNPKPPFIYSGNIHGIIPPGYAADTRELRQCWAEWNSKEPEGIKTAIRAAIERGLITKHPDDE